MCAANCCVIVRRGLLTSFPNGAVPGCLVQVKVLALGKLWFCSLRNA